MTELFKKKNKVLPSPEKTCLAREYSELTERLSAIRANFDFAEDDCAIDALIFEENAVLARLSAMYREARESGIQLEPYDLQNIKKYNFF